MLCRALGIREGFKEFVAEVAADTSGNMHVKHEKFVDDLMDQCNDIFGTDVEAEAFLFAPGESEADIQFKAACAILNTYVVRDYADEALVECSEQIMVECGDIFENEDDARAFLLGEY